MAFDRVTVKFDGEFHEFPIEDLDIPSDPDDSHVLSAVNQKLSEIHSTSVNLSNYVVDPPIADRRAGQYNDMTVLTVRPSASFGLNRSQM